jgi:site-specific DNA-methyltransferase (adenine-specific)
MQRVRGPLYDLYHCPDSIEVVKTLNPGSVDLCICDPPYNSSHKNSSIQANFSGMGPNAGRRDFGDWDYLFDPHAWFADVLPVLCGNAQMYVFSSDALLEHWLNIGRTHFDKFMLLPWLKPDPQPLFRQRQWIPASENVVWMARGNYQFNWLGHSLMYNWRIMQAPKQNDRIHPNQKPLPLIQRFLDASPSHVVLDPFLGSGTVGEAAVKAGRFFIGMDSDSEMFNKAVKRIESAALHPTLPVVLEPPVVQEPFTGELHGCGTQF